MSLKVLQPLMLLSGTAKGLLLVLLGLWEENEVVSSRGGVATVTTLEKVPDAAAVVVVVVVVAVAVVVLMPAVAPAAGPVI